MLSVHTFSYSCASAIRKDLGHFVFFFDTDLVSDKLILILGVLGICQRLRKTETIT